MAACSSVINRIIAPLSKKRRLAILFVLVLLFEFLFMNVLGPGFRELTNGTEVLDMTLFYSPEQAYGMIADYGPAGRSYYNIIQVADLFFPLVYSFLLMGILYRLLDGLHLYRKRWRLLIWLPVLTGLCDWLENLGIFATLRLYPQRFDNIAQITNLACVAKFAGIGMSIGLILILGLVLMVRETRFKRA